MSQRTLARLRRQLKSAGITQDAVAREAHVGRTLVNHVLAGRAKSKNVVDTMKRMVNPCPPQESPSV